MLDYLETSMIEDDVVEIATMLLSRLNQCINIGSKYKLPSVAQGAMWSAFHQLQQDLQLKKSWNAFIYLPLWRMLY